MTRFGRLVVGACLVLAQLVGCSSLLPSSKNVTRSPWRSFEEAKEGFDRIVPKTTTVHQLKGLGFDLYSTPNIRTLNYLDLAVATQSLKREELDGVFTECFNAKKKCRAYEFEPKWIDTKRYGNFWLDMLNFKRQTRDTGWQFKALLIVIDDVVVDKLWSGNPMIVEEREQNNPLGPLQESGSMILKLIP